MKEMIQPDQRLQEDHHGEPLHKNPTIGHRSVHSQVVEEHHFVYVQGEAEGVQKHV